MTVLCTSKFSGWPCSDVIIPLCKIFPSLDVILILIRSIGDAVVFVPDSELAHDVA